MRPLVSFPDDDFLRRANEPGHLAPEDLSEHLAHRGSSSVDTQVVKHLSTCRECRKLATSLASYATASRAATENATARTITSTTSRLYDDVSGTSSISGSAGAPIDSRQVNAFDFDDIHPSDPEPTRHTFAERVDEIFGWFQNNFNTSAPLPNMASQMPDPDLSHHDTAHSHHDTTDYSDTGYHAHESHGLSSGGHDLDGGGHDHHDAGFNDIPSDDV